MGKRLWFRRFYERPQQLWLRRAAFQIHLWLGVLLTLYLAALGISGSVLVFKDELMPRPAYTGQRVRPGACTPEQVIEAMGAAAAREPGQRAVLASCPTGADPFFAVNLRAAGGAERTFYVPPESYQVAGSVDQDASWVGLVDRFHMELLLPRNGRQWNGLGAAALLLAVVSGLVVWWPGVSRWTRGFQVLLRAKWRRLVWDLHGAVGIWTVLFLLMWAATTLYFAWPATVEHAVARASALTTAHYPAEELDRFATSPQEGQVGSAIDLRGVLEQAVELSPSAHLEGVFLGAGRRPVLTVYMARGAEGDYARTDFVYFDQQTGRYLFTWHRGVNHTAGDWVMWSMAPLHFGTSWGLVGKCVWAAAGLALPLLGLTGLVMWWNRSLSKQMRRRLG